MRIIRITLGVAGGILLALLAVEGLSEWGKHRTCEDQAALATNLVTLRNTNPMLLARVLADPEGWESLVAPRGMTWTAHSIRLLGPIIQGYPDLSPQAMAAEVRRQCRDAVGL